MARLTPRGLRGRRAPRRATPRASSTTCARSRARRSRRCRASSTGPTPATAAARRCRCARPTATSTSRRSPARAAAAATARRRLHDRAGRRRARRVPARADRRAARQPGQASLRGSGSQRLAPACGTGAGWTASCWSTSPPGRRRTTSSRAVRRDAAARGRRSATPARSTRSPPGCCSCCVGRATRVAALPDGAAQGLRDGRRGWGGPRRPATPRARSPRPAAIPPSRRRAADRRAPPAPAGLHRGPGRRRARLRAGAGAGRRSRSPSARCTSTRFEERWRDGDRAAFVDRVLVGHLRPLADRRPRRRLLRGAAPHRDRPVRRRGRRPPRRRSAIADDCAACLRSSRSTRRCDGGSAHGAGDAAPRRPAAARPSRWPPLPCRATTADGGRSPSREPRTDGALEARRRLPGVKRHATCPTSEPRPRRVAGRHVRRRPPRPPRGHRGRRHRR